MIELVNLNKYFFKGKQKEIHVINDVSLKFDDKGFVCITGPSGCGKTTLLNVIGLTDSFNSGEIKFNNNNFTKYSISKFDKFRNEKIGFIYQNYNLDPELTVFENLNLRLKLAGYFNIEENEKIINDALKIVGLKSYGKRLASNLSGGQKQRVGIARAILFDPGIILADEPTGNLDSDNTIYIMKLLKKLSNKKLIILVSHEKEIAKIFCDKLIYLEDGKVIKEEINNSDGKFHTNEKNTIYLEEYQNYTLINDNANIKIYKNDETLDKLNLVIFQKGNDLIIKSDKNIIPITEDSDIKIKESKKPDPINVNELKNEEINLSKPVNKITKRKLISKRSKLFFEALKRVFFNRKFFSKIFIFTIFLISFILPFITSRTEVNFSATNYIKRFNDKSFALKSKKENFTKKDIKLLLEKHPNLNFKGYNYINNLSSYITFELTFLSNRIKTINLIPQKISSLKDENIKNKIKSPNDIIITNYIYDKLKYNQKFINTKYLTSKEDMIGHKLLYDNKEFTIVYVTNSNDPFLYSNDNVYNYFNENVLTINLNKKIHYDLNNFISLDTINLFKEIKEDEHIKKYDHNSSINLNKINEDINNLEDINFSLLKEKLISNPDNNIFNIIVGKDKFINLIKKNFLENNRQLIIKDAFDLNKNYILNIIGITTKEKDDNIYISKENKRILSNNYALTEFTSLVGNGISDEFHKVSSSFFNDKLYAFFTVENEDTFNVNDLFSENNKSFSKNNLVIDNKLDLNFKNKLISKKILSGLRLLGITLFLLTMSSFSLYFMIRTSIMVRMKDIIVMRVIGISRKEIMLNFFYEIIIYFLFIFLPGSLISGGIIWNGMLNVNGFKNTLNLSFLNFILLNLGVFLFLILVGIIPNIIFLKNSPAKLQTKYEN